MCWFIARCIVLRSGTIGVQVQVDRCVNKKCRLSDYLAGKSFCQRFDWIVGTLRGGVFFCSGKTRAQFEIYFFIEAQQFY